MISAAPPARNDDAVIQAAIQKRLPNLYDDPISNCAPTGQPKG